MNKTLSSLAFGFLILGIPSLSAAPYFDWMNDYTGAEANTIALWKFDTAGVGVSGNSYAGSDYTKSTLTFPGSNVQTGVAGKFGQGFFISASGGSADDSSAYVSGTNGSPQTLFNGSAMSIEMWFKPVELTLSSSSTYLYDQIYADSNPQTRFGGTSFRLSATNELVFSVGNGTAVVSTSSDALLWKADQWYHLAVTFENVEDDGVLKIYRDGILVASDTFTAFGNAAAGTQRYRIGNRRGSGHAPSPGYYDNFRISNVAYEYAAIPEPSAVAQWGFGASLLIVAAWRSRRKS